MLKPFILFLLLHLSNTVEFSPYKDDILFRIDWHPSNTKLSEIELGPGQKLDESNTYKMKTSSKEEYSCTLPSLDDSVDEKDDGEVSSNHEPQNLLAPLFKKSACAQRLETYWTYEVCHGKHVRQYHEEKVRSFSKTLPKSFTSDKHGGKVTYESTKEDNTLIMRTEFMLGWFEGLVDEEGVLVEPVPKVYKTREELPTIKIDGASRPYFAVNYTLGTPCEVKPGMKRRTRVMYVCSGNSNWYQVSAVTEVSTCEYQIVFHSPMLCKNPFFRVVEKQVNKIQCIAEEGSPKKPQALMVRESKSALSPESLLQKVLDQAFVISDAPGGKPYTLEDLEKGNIKVKFVEVNSEDADLEDLDPDTSPAVNLQKKAPQVKMEKSKPIKTVKHPNIDKSAIQDFLRGTFCFKGGTGWWRFEFCYGKHVIQYHDDPPKKGQAKSTSRTTINLGKWDGDKHREWAASRDPIMWKRTAEGKKEKVGVQQLYAGGDYCEETKTNRQVIVSMKCRETSSMNAVIIYLREPETCSYHLTVESGIICELLDNVDDEGLFHL